MDPVTGALIVGGGVGLASGILQYMNSQEARKLSAEQYAKVQAMYDNLKQANFDVSAIKPEDYQVLQQYVPQQAKFVAEARPELVEGKSAGAMEGRAAQEEALRSLMASGRGDDPRLQAALNQASRTAETSAGAQRESILQRFARQGQLTSGASLAAQLQGSSDAMERGAMAGNQAAQQSYTDRLNALRQGAELGGQIRGQDISLEEQQKNILNSFNQRNTAAARQFNQGNVEQANQAQLLNMQQAQGAADRNVAARNAEAIRAQNNANNYNQQQWQNNYSTIQGRQGLAGSQVSNIMGGAQDKNAMYQGVANVGMTGAMGYADYAQRQQDRDLKQQQIDLEREKAGLGNAGGSYNSSANVG